MFAFTRNFLGSFSMVCLFVVPVFVQAEENPVSATVQKNISQLKETNSCPNCDLSSGDLNRMELAGANLEGANLSRAKMYLSNLAGANLRNADLRETGFGGADLGDADLRGADLRGTSFAGAYLGGTLFDGEMVATTPYLEDNISDVEETVYVDDTAVSKVAPETEQLTIATPRVFEETPPSLPESTETEQKSAATAVAAGSVSKRDHASSIDAKKAPSMQKVKVPSAVTEARPEISPKKENVEQIAVLKSKQLKTRVEPAAEESRESKTEETVSKEVMVPEEIAVEEQSVEEMAPDKAAADEIEEVEETINEESVATVNTKSETTTEGNTTSVPKVEKEAEVPPTEAIDTVVEEKLSAPANDAIKIEKNLERLLDRKQCYSCNLAGVDLSGEDLEDADLEGADLSHANLRGADLEGANLKGAILIGADLKNADLSKADLYKADLTGADLTGADLEETLLDETVMIGVEGYQQGSLLLMK